MSGESVAGAVPARSSLPELTWQAVVGAFVVSSLVVLSYPYTVLKLGLGFNASLLSAFLGALFLHAAAARTRGSNRLMNNVIQTAGTSATSTAFMCVVAAAFGYLSQNQSVDLHVTITPLHMFLWLICSGAIGVLFIPVFRRYFLDDPEMVFTDGVAAAETIQVLDTQAGRRRRSCVCSACRPSLAGSPASPSTGSTSRRRSTSSSGSRSGSGGASSRSVSGSRSDLGSHSPSAWAP
jgi:uncharacterized oligopeptide transporter (OPT) family protein